MNIKLGQQIKGVTGSCLPACMVVQVNNLVDFGYPNGLALRGPRFSSS